MVAQSPKNTIEPQPIIDPSRAHTDILSEEQRAATKRLEEERERKDLAEHKAIRQAMEENAKKKQAEKEKREKEAEQRKEEEQAREAKKAKESDRRFDGRSIKGPLETPATHGMLSQEEEKKAAKEARKQAVFEKLKADRVKEKELGNER